MGCPGVSHLNKQFKKLKEVFITQREQNIYGANSRAYRAFTVDTSDYEMFNTIQAYNVFDSSNFPVVTFILKS